MNSLAWFPQSIVLPALLPILTSSHCSLEETHTATDKALHGLAPAHLSSVITFLPLPIPHLGCGELHSGLQMFYIFCCLRAFACVSSAWNNPSLILCQDSHYSDFSKLRPSFLPNWKAVVTPTICCTVNSFLSLVTQHFTLLYWQM